MSVVFLNLDESTFDEVERLAGLSGLAPQGWIMRLVTDAAQKRRVFQGRFRHDPPDLTPTQRAERIQAQAAALAAHYRAKND